MVGHKPQEGERIPDMDDGRLAQRAGVLLESERNLLANSAKLASLIYSELADVNWSGFYFKDGDDLVLGPFAGKPACTRIAIGHGVCGKAAQLRQTVVVDDVNQFEGHIACDSASRSEIVVPLLRNGELIGVFDIDSERLARFTAEVRLEIEKLVQRLMDRSDLPVKPPR